MKKRVLLGNFPQDYCDMIREQKRDKANMSSQLRSNTGNFKLHFMTDKDLLQFCFHSKSQIYEILNFAQRSGLKKSNKLGIDQKMLIFLMFLKLNLSDADLAVLFDVDRSTIQRAGSEVQFCLKGNV